MISSRTHPLYPPLFPERGNKRLRSSLNPLPERAALSGLSFQVCAVGCSPLILSLSKGLGKVQETRGFLAGVAGGAPLFYLLSPSPAGEGEQGGEVSDGYKGRRLCAHGSASSRRAEEGIPIILSLVYPELAEGSKDEEGDFGMSFI